MNTTPSRPPVEAPWTPDVLAGDPHAAVDKADRVRRMFAAIARTYDLNNRLHSFGRDQAWRAAAVRAAQVRTGDAVLDAACGTGDLALAFVRAGAGRVVGVDFTPEMLDLARAKAAALTSSGASALSFEPADVMRLPFDDASFEIVSIAFGIRNVTDPGRALAEFHRVLRPGGRLVILEFGRPRSPLLRAVNAVYTRRVMPVTAALIARDRSGAYRYLPRSVETFLSPEGLAESMRGRGFADVRATPLTFGVCSMVIGRKLGALAQS
jgi:demethylmenaquinone methyltransferase/2-methoxy-6-polyprenyl-1,4-benzoquinol methylase